jgi:integrase
VLDRLAAELGPSRQLADVPDEEIAAALRRLRDASAPATWNRNRAAVVSWLNWCAQKKRWPAPQLPPDAERRKENNDATRALPRGRVERLLSRRGRRHCGGCSATPSSSTGTPAPRTCCPGSCACPTAHRAPAGRCSRPAAGPSPRRPAPRDIGPHTGRGRLGYDRARILFKKHTGGLDLHQLRHSAATHLGDQKVPLQLIMAKTRHKSPRTVMRYVKPGDEAIAEVTSLLGPPRRTH